MKEFFEKLKSRKFLACVVGIIVGIVVVFGVDEGTISTIAGAVVSIGSIVAYIVTEGAIDAKAIQSVKDFIEKSFGSFENADGESDAECNKEGLSINEEGNVVTQLYSAENAAKKNG